MIIYYSAMFYSLSISYILNCFRKDHVKEKKTYLRYTRYNVEDNYNCV